MSEEQLNGWTELSLEQPPHPSPMLLVTNNICGRNAHGFMSHIWLVSMVHEKNGEFCAFRDDGYSKVEFLTHWRYAVPADLCSLADPDLLMALKGLTGNAGALTAFEHEIREVVGNTNWQCLIDAIRQADAAIARIKAQSHE